MSDGKHDCAGTKSTNRPYAGGGRCGVHLFGRPPQQRRKRHPRRPDLEQRGAVPHIHVNSAVTQIAAEAGRLPAVGRARVGGRGAWGGKWGAHVSARSEAWVNKWDWAKGIGRVG